MEILQHKLLKMKDDKTLLQTLKEYWFIILFIIQFVYMVAFNASDHTTYAREIQELKNDKTSTQVILSEVKARLASIDTNLEYLKKNK